MLHLLLYFSIRSIFLCMSSIILTMRSRSKRARASRSMRVASSSQYKDCVVLTMVPMNKFAEI